MTTISDFKKSLRYDTETYLRNNLPSIHPSASVGDGYGDALHVKLANAICLSITFFDEHALVKSTPDRPPSEARKIEREFEYRNPEFPDNMHRHVMVRSAMSSVGRMLKLVRELGHINTELDKAKRSYDVNKYQHYQADRELKTYVLERYAECINVINSITENLTRLE
jgi:hypothetical protein